MQDITSNKTRILVFLFPLLFTLSCQNYNNFYFVKNEGAIMPVKIRGNLKSQKYIVLLPGGPSGDGLIFRAVFPMFKKHLETKYKMVYYDQRGAGNCQGVYGTNTLNLSQLGEDLDKLIQSIKERDQEAKVYLLGYSFGGTLGLDYLRKPENQLPIEGFISISGAFDRKNQKENQDKLITYLLNKWMERGEIKDYNAIKLGFNCNEADDLEKCRLDSIETVKQINLKLAGLESYNQFKLTIGGVKRLLGYSFFSQSNPIQSGLSEGQNAKYYQEEFDNQLLSEQVGEIKVPILLINGRYDTNVPFFEANQVYENIGTPTGKKSIVILEESGHLPMITEPEKLSNSIITFIEMN
jgi:pimeloyl-ACP methyl ester carboxylesterase